MAIYNIFDYSESDQKSYQENEAPSIDPSPFFNDRYGAQMISSSREKGKLFSAIAARFFFFLLFIADIGWGIYSMAMLCVKALINLITFGKWERMRSSYRKTKLSVKRSIVCALALFVAIFSPALGIMFSCMYFLMYDKKGVDEVVPSSLRDQFKELFPTT